MPESSSESVSSLQPPRKSSAVISRPLTAILLFLGAIGFGGLSIWIRFLARQNGRFVLSESDRVLTSLPIGLVLTVLACVLAGCVGLGLALRHDIRLHAAWQWLRNWIRRHPFYAITLALAVFIGAVDWYEFFYDPFSRRWGPYIYRLRDDLQIWLLWFSLVTAALGLSALCQNVSALGEKMILWRQRLTSRPLLWWLLILILPVLMGAGLCVGALEGIPHFSDSLTYLMQGRILWHGSLSLPSPKHIELFQHSLFFLSTDGRFYGKYPLGWPSILGTFDHFHLGFLANAVLASILALLTAGLARPTVGRKYALVAAGMVAGSPWVWFHAAEFASHVASACAVTAFLLLFICLFQNAKEKSLSPQASPDDSHPGFLRLCALALVTGLVLGAAILIRPGDAANFALPVIALAAYGLIRHLSRWIGLNFFITLGALAGVAIYFWSNSVTTGHPLLSPYKLEGRWQSDWNPTFMSAIARFFFQLIEINHRFPGSGLGGFTFALAGWLIWKQHAAHHHHAEKISSTALGLVLASTTIFFVFNTAFGFTNVWWGPRWLLPVVPLLAILLAVGFVHFWQQSENAHLSTPDSAETQKKNESAQAASQLVMLLLLAAITSGTLLRYAGQFYELKLNPPHSVSAAVHKQIQAMGITHAVVAMPLMGKRAPLDARAGLVFLSVPFESNQVIYVRAVPGWQEMVKDDFPTRRRYEVVPDKNDASGFQINDLDSEKTSPP